ncbi:hypothetical protein BN135_3097 [Cronobacter muytjensii 530]
MASIFIGVRRVALSIHLYKESINSLYNLSVQTEDKTDAILAVPAAR